MSNTLARGTRLKKGLVLSLQRDIADHIQSKGQLIEGTNTTLINRVHLADYTQINSMLKPEFLEGLVATPRALRTYNERRIIPYVIFQDMSTEKVLTYSRGSQSASDLTSKTSIGFGGHIDSTIDFTTLYDAMYNFDFNVNCNIDREIKEELGWDISASSDALWQFALMSDTGIDDVSTYYMAFVFLVQVDRENMPPINPEFKHIDSLQWLTIDEVSALPNNEEWTKAVAALM